MFQTINVSCPFFGTIGRAFSCTFLGYIRSRVLQDANLVMLPATAGTGQTSFLSLFLRGTPILAGGIGVARVVVGAVFCSVVFVFERI